MLAAIFAEDRVSVRYSLSNLETAFSTSHVEYEAWCEGFITAGIFLGKPVSCFMNNDVTSASVCASAKAYMLIQTVARRSLLLLLASVAVTMMERERRSE